MKSSTKRTYESTYDREMRDPKFRKMFNKAYKELILSELMHAIMQGDEKSVRELAKEAKVSPTIIQNIRSAKQKDMKLKNFINIIVACGFHMVLEKGKDRFVIA
ncbi:MAG: hypothetical protein SFW07_00725 [Gammaproteobacteria bacterium]|nr:hypothetical protein [Gammaproteobacteria bacterium]